MVRFSTTSFTSSEVSISSAKSSFNLAYIKNFQNLKTGILYTKMRKFIFFVKVKQKIVLHKDSINSQLNHYSSEKALPLTVACHFKVK